ncbi:F0F1 ATP synthase subunit A [TM7 phylum sp. oral taxon 352]|nr:F0F1 ATP synthase subunit A [TM7 phylum sp. oral taxon 351]TWP14280.1 F0F1 ATP synthase subunit A [TM7 phylum sp. oral taxon 352]TWP15491.1 F0F1 ATP synthase subunit A [TM7 phylum sp. oral taxon 352]TWP18628.1 F0F1 ATP synthase subunit A [TM7 phylum sp. oral taxon 352]TWP18724.1 F0F1 ATP synthase subunit A [TM7 phylum sp. oral taxon 352]
MGFLGLIVLVWAMFRTRAAVLGKKKHNFITRLIQWTFDGLYNTVCQVIPDRKWARKVAPLCITLFFFIVAQYWLGLLPIVGPITIGEHHTPLFRGGVADLNMTFGLAIVTIVAAQVYAFKYLGFKGNLGRYFINPLRDPIMSFVGILELVAEFSRMLGLSFRLFGNVLAGEILLAIIAYMTKFLSPVALQPFYFFELFIGGIQAYIFFMLSTVFISLGLAHHDSHEPIDDVHSSVETNKLATSESD